MERGPQSTLQRVALGNTSRVFLRPCAPRTWRSSHQQRLVAQGAKPCSVEKGRMGLCRATRRSILLVPSVRENTAHFSPAARWVHASTQGPNVGPSAPRKLTFVLSAQCWGYTVVPGVKKYGALTLAHARRTRFLWCSQYVAGANRRPGRYQNTELQSVGLSQANNVAHSVHSLSLWHHRSLGRCKSTGLIVFFFRFLRTCARKVLSSWLHPSPHVPVPGILQYHVTAERN